MNTRTPDALVANRIMPSDVRANIAAALANYYSELSTVESAPLVNFSLARMLCSLAERRGLTKREHEVCEGAAILYEQTYDPHRNWVPLPAIDVRAMATVPGSKGGYLIGVDTRAPIDVLRPWSVVASAGATLLTNLRDSVLIPRTALVSTASWLGAEGGAGPSESPPTLGNVSLTSRTAITLVKFSAQLLRQGEAAEPFVRAHLLRVVGELLDVAFFAGPGGVQPLGLLQTTGIGAQSGTSLAHAGILAMRQKVLNKGGIESALQWVGTPDVQELIGGRERATGGGRFLWDNDGILGKPAYATKNAPANALTAGDFSQAVVGLFGPGIRIDVDPSQDFNSAGLVARVLLFCDVAFPQPGAFCVATSVT